MISQIPKVNELERSLEIQDEDKELTVLSKKITKSVKESTEHLAEGNKKIREKVNMIPKEARVLSDKEYENEMGFILRH